MAFSASDVPVVWHQSLNEVPDGPGIVLANEFIDALPVNQAIKQFNGWYERVVEIGGDDNLAFGIADEPIPLFDQLVPAGLRDAPIGAIYEWRPDTLALDLAQRVKRQGGAALLIDYGHVKSAIGETLQAIRGQTHAHPLAVPGEADLTAHVDFEAIALAAESLEARVHGPVSQASFLRNLGIEKRAAALKAYAPKEKAAEIEVAVQRLLAEGDTGMGKLFKVIAIADPKLGHLPGFEGRA
jgi:SAM-dependent MidA family methyltransferase